MDLSKMSMTELKYLLQQAANEEKSLEKSELESARNEVYAIAHRMGLPLKDLIGTGIRKTTGKVAVQYRNPANTTEEWTGRGRQPRWIKAWLETEKSLDALRV